MRRAPKASSGVEIGEGCPLPSQIWGREHHEPPPPAGSGAESQPQTPFEHFECHNTLQVKRKCNTSA